MNSNNFKTKENSKNNINKLPFDVMNNIKLINNQIGNNNNLMNWVKTQPNFKGVIPYYFTPIVENQKQYDLYNFEENENIYFVRKEDVSKIPLKNIEITTDNECNITSITLIISIKDKLFRVVSQKNYGVIKSRYLVNPKGDFKNYDKCDLIPFDGEYKEYRWNNKGYGNDCSELNKVFNYCNGIKDGECRTYYSGNYPFHLFKSEQTDVKIYWYEMFTYYFGKKEGLYENTKKLERGMIQNGKRVGEWIVEPPKDVRIPNFNNMYGGEYKLDRMKCTYLNNKLEGKWEGITRDEYFGKPKQKDSIHKVIGEFKNGYMDGDFYSEFWNNEFEIIKGKFKNNSLDGEWTTKVSEVSCLRKWSDESFPENKIWVTWDPKGENQLLLTSEEVDNYEIISDVYLEQSHRRSLKRKVESFVKNELISVEFTDYSGDYYSSYELVKEKSPFDKYIEKYLPEEYQNKGFTINKFNGNISDGGNLKNITINRGKENILGYGNFCDNLLLENGYSITKIGKDFVDKRKSKSYPSLPSNSVKYFEIGQYDTLSINFYGEKIELISIDNEVYELGKIDSKVKWEEKKQQIINNVVNLLMESKKKELKEIKEEQEVSNTFSFYPMD